MPCWPAIPCWKAGRRRVKPAPFAYAKAKSLDHAIELLARPDGEARLHTLREALGREHGYRMVELEARLRAVEAALVAGGDEARWSAEAGALAAERDPSRVAPDLGAVVLGPAHHGFCLIERCGIGVFGCQAVLHAEHDGLDPVGDNPAERVIEVDRAEHPTTAMQPHKYGKGRVTGGPVEPDRGVTRRPRDADLADFGDVGRVPAHGREAAGELAPCLDGQVLDPVEAGGGQHVDQGLRLRIKGHRILLGGSLRQRRVAQWCCRRSGASSNS